MKDYSDIIGRSRPKSRRPPMAMEDRAAQFAPFAALTGHEAALSEVARRTEERVALSDDEQAGLDRAVARLRESLSERPHVQLTYFAADPYKDGGSYATVEGDVRVIDDLAGALEFTDGCRIPLADIVSFDISPLR